MAVLSTTASRDGRTTIVAWLLVCCAMIFAMVVLGGVTRLTESGLSMVDWQPVMGALPPTSDAAWHAAFERYKASPEFQKLNFWMTLADFKEIFWYEYLHRLWGRLIGIVFAVPFVYFLLRRRVDRALAIRLAIGLALGAMQGVLGWLMVRSGLVDRPDVSHYRLAAHLGLAMLIYGYLLWLALDLMVGRSRDGRASEIRPFADLVVGWTFLTAMVGAFVAGLDAGHIYNTFPLMDGGFFPDAMFRMEPWPINLVENPGTVQFVHRTVAILLVVLVLALWLRVRRLAEAPTTLAAWLAAAGVVQAGLGISTLLSGVEIWVAATHQAGAMVVFTLALWTAHASRARA